MNTRVKVEGVPQLMRAFDQAPANLMKIARTAMRAGAKATATQIRTGVPGQWSGLTKAKVGKTYRGELYASAGLRSKGHRTEQSGKEVDDWFKAYWANYGTLENRDPNHRFANPVRRSTTAVALRRRNRRGQKAQNFFENAIRGWDDTFMRAFTESIEKQKDKILK